MCSEKKRKSWKRVIKWTLWSLLILLLVLSAGVGIVLHWVFTPEKLAGIVEKVADEFLDIIQTKFTDIVNNGRSISVDFSFEQTSSLSMSTEIGSEGLTLSDQIELWMSEHAYKNNYHIQGTTDKRMIFDDVRIPLKDSNGNNYNINRFGLEFLKFARSNGLQIARQISNNTLVIIFK